MNFYFVIPYFDDNAESGLTTEDFQKNWRSQANNKYLKDLENAREGKDIEHESFFTEGTVQTNGGAPLKRESYPNTKSLENYPYRDLVLRRVAFEHLNGTKKLETRVMTRIINILNSDYDLSTKNETQFNALFGDPNGGVWSQLNNNPGGTFGTLSDETKTDISFRYAVSRHFFSNIFTDFKRSYTGTFSVSEVYPDALHSGNILETQKNNKKRFTNYVNSHQNVDEAIVTPVDFSGKFRTAINSNLFFIPSQVVGIQEIEEGGIPYKLKQKDHD